MVIDAHQHFWKFDPIRDSWIDDSMKVLRVDFFPDDLYKEMQSNGIDGSVAVQADQSVDETEFLLGLSENNDFIKGVVGWLDLRSDQLEKDLVQYSANKKFKGLRHILQAEPSGFMLSDDFVKGVSSLAAHDLSYDILCYHHQLPEVKDFVSKLPEMRLVIDHLAKPDLKKDVFKDWAQNMQEISKYEHVYVKLSGMVTETHWDRWSPDVFTPYLDFCMEHFGAERLMFGSDWPVCKLAATYTDVFQVIKNYISTLSQAEQSKILGETAVDFYQL